MPLATLVAGPLADYVMEPAMNEGGSLASVFGPIVGVGPGAGMALTIAVASVAMALIGFGGYLFPILRGVETRIPEDEIFLAGDIETASSD